MSPRATTSLKEVPAVSAELRHLREQAGLSQADLAERAGYSAKTIKRWEIGEQAPRDAVVQLLRTLPGNAAPRSKGTEEGFRFIDLFAGIGGLRIGFESIGGTCVFTSEWDKYSQITYRANFGEHEIKGDIVPIASSTIPEHDVLLAGFPCQPFSIAGVSKKNSLGRPHGFECDTQGTLFFEVERIIRHHRPKAFVLENVKNLVSHDRGNTFRTIMRVLREDLGYHVTAKVFDARCVVPQHRERIFIVGFKEDLGFDWSMVQLPNDKDGPTLGSILHPEDGSELPEAPFTDANGKVNRKYVLSDHLWQYLQDYAEKHRLKGNGFGYSLFGPDDVARTLSARYHKDGSEILIRRRRGNPRRLTPRECARLMGFDRPDKPFSINVSDTQAYRQFGNSVVVPVVEAIARALRPFLTSEVSSKDQLRFELADRG